VLVCLLGVLATAQPGAAQPLAAASSDVLVRGEVTYVSANAVYLRGEGLAALPVGSVLRLGRGERAGSRVQVLGVHGELARARLLPGEPGAQIADRFELRRPRAPTEAPGPEASPAPSKPKQPLPADGALPALWQHALTRQARTLRPPPDEGTRRQTRHVRRARVTWTGSAVAWDATRGPDRYESRLGLWLRVDDVALPGLDLRARGDLLLRLDDARDRYLARRRVVARIRELQLRLRRGPLAGALGRLPSPTRRRGPLDGASAGWRQGSVEVVAFGGLQPDPVDLAVRTDAQRYGVVGRWRPARYGRLRLSADAGVQGETWQGELGHQSLLLDARAEAGRRWLLDGSATLDLSYPDPDSGDRLGPGLAQASVWAHGELVSWLGVSLTLRHHEEHLGRAWATSLPPEWVRQMQGATSQHGRVALDFKLSDRSALRPYGHVQRGSSGEPTSLAGGLGWHRAPPPGGGAGWGLMADTAWGFARLADVEGYVTWLLAQGWALHGGWHTLWSQGQDSYAHALQHLLRLRLRARPTRRLSATLGLQGALDHSGSVAGPKPLTGWYGGELGVEYAW